MQKIDNEISFIVDAWKEGKIVAIKGIGGYLITCDAENFSAIKRLRKLKKRPTKPLAIMHPDLLLLAEDAEIIEPARLEMRGESSPIVLVNLIKNEDRVAKTAYNEIAPNLNHIGVMLPYTPLYELLLREFARPIIATSGNISGSTIIYENDKANQHLSKIADVIVLNDRPIVLPQDDSVIRYSYVKCQRIILRRSRGLAPSFLIKQSQNLPSKTVLCMGAMMKSTFSILFNGNIFVSQYLGNTEDFENQLNFNKTLNHLLNLLGAIPDIIVVDKHPNYYTRQYGYELAKTIGAEVIALQHHKAHFYSVLGEHGLLESDEKILGVVWDGTGYGEDGHIWGGEFFVFSHGAMERVRHLDYYDFILGDKMPKEPRISAFAISDGDDRVLEKFTEEEWRIYKILLAKDGNIQCSSAGRLFDAAASIILNIDKQSFEGEAAMRLESAAYEYFRKNGATIFYTYLSDEKIPENFPKFIIQKIMEDVAKGCEPAFLAAKFHITLANYISLVAKDIGVHKVVFSGGVFQNGWLVDLIYLFMQQDYELLFHVDLSPNDEGVSFGQLQSIINSTLVS